ncbi:hypothetical protein FAZ19_19695 [Sphingobacterium alkalisoli]|uniref:Phage portal protein n=1 Tax=Sphingobacterium alkalisoli TaxID=1874115 RepID=A0A4U0GUE5_9SPHI|nr:hypothetical protein [Sphingobacterium alkalisoli]TJY62695.1 hypothetical protein FAZ19_19695 [Sphingobacterium alkalisoli]GGH28260.1 hypothetical protein GCM10011418_38790 [Sphingobacterium alkalisoli]
MSEVEYVGDQHALICEGRVLVDMGPTNVAPLSAPPASPVKKEQDQSEIANWGEENDFPQKIIEAAKLSTELVPLMDWQSRALQGREVSAMQRFFDSEKGEWALKAVGDADIDAFLQDRRFKRYMREAAVDFFWFWNVFPELIKSIDEKTIAYLGTQDASHCRWSKMDAKGRILKCFVNANWPEAKAKDKETITYDVIDPYSNTSIDEVRNSKAKSFVYPISYPSPGHNYYQLAKWNGFLASGWYDIAKNIPKTKVSVMKRMLSVTHILYIPADYWPNAYKDWGKKSPEDKTAIKKAKVKEINDQLTGADNAGKTILAEIVYDHNGKPLPGWEIKPVEQLKLDGNHLEDSREASEHLMRALGVDPTLVGDGPGKKLGGGGGSDKRMAFNIYVALLQPYRDVILEPLYFIAEYNGWLAKYPGLCFKTTEIELETLDKNHQTANEVVN